MKKIISILSFIFLISGCASTVNVEYPVFPNNKEGRQLRSFVGTKKNVAVVVEPPQKGLWSSIFEDSSFIDQMPSKVFESIDKEGYYKMIDVSKTPALMNEIAFSLTGLTAKRLQLGKQLQADMFLYVGYQKPATVCAGTNRDLLIPLDVTLIKTETGETMKAVASKNYRQSGTGGCPSVLEVFSNALDDASRQIMSRLSPKVKTVAIKIATKDADPDVTDALKEGYLEVTGETPNMAKAVEYWKKADKKAKGKSEGALGNIGAYYFSVGDFEEAIKYFEKAVELKGADRDYYRELRKKVEAASAVNDKES